MEIIPEMTVARGVRLILRAVYRLFLDHLCKAAFHLANEETAFIADNLDIPFTSAEEKRAHDKLKRLCPT